MTSITRRALTALGAALAALVASPPVGLADTVPAGRPLDWEVCTDTGWECATATVPKVYGQSSRGRFTLAVTRLPATDQENKVGSLFVNYGGPGASAVDITQAIGAELFGAFRERFDIVAFDPRGTGATSQAIDCQADQETEGVYSQPFFEPGDDLSAYLRRIDAYWDECRRLNPGVLPYTATANVARDMDLLRRSVGDDRLTYVGFSYGTFLGETYAALFPRRMRALVLDGAVDPEIYIDRPTSHLRIQTAGFELALQRFFQACAGAPTACTFAGEGGDPGLAFDRLLEQAEREPVPAGGADARPVDRDDILFATLSQLYSKFAWTGLAQALNQLAAGDATLMRQLANDSYGRLEDGTYGPFSDRYLALSAEQRYPNDLRTYVETGEESWAAFPHFWFNVGFVELYWRAIPVRAQGRYGGPWALPESSTGTPLVIGTRYDPATPYREALLAVQRLGRARLLTLDGDGHTAYFNGSACIDAAVAAYVTTLALPAEGTQCEQDVPFPLPAETVRAEAATSLEHGYAGRGVVPLRPAR